jgi:anti-anti-sigma factor
MTQLSIIVEQRPAFCLISLGGELDRFSQADFSRELDRILTRPEPRIVVDMTRLGFCDSKGLWTLIQRQRRAEARGGSLRLIGVHGPLARLLTVTQLVDLFPPYADLAQASTWPGVR